MASTNRAVSLYPCAIQCQQIEVKSAQRGGDLITWIRIRYVAETYAVPSASSNKQVNLVVTSTFGSHRNTYNFKVISTADSFSSQSYSYIPPQSFFTAQLSLAGPSLRIIYLSKITDLPPKQDLNMMLPIALLVVLTSSLLYIYSTCIALMSYASPTTQLPWAPSLALRSCSGSQFDCSQGCVNA